MQMPKTSETLKVELCEMALRFYKEELILSDNELDELLRSDRFNATDLLYLYHRYGLQGAKPMRTIELEHEMGVSKSLVCARIRRAKFVLFNLAWNSLHPAKEEEPIPDSDLEGMDRRAYSSLRNNGIHTIAQLTGLSSDDLMKLRRFGGKLLQSVREFLHEKSLHLANE